MGRVKTHGSGRVGSGHPTRPQPEVRDVEDLLTRPVNGPDKYYISQLES